MVIKKFIDYIVNDDPNKYPSNGVHTDGYWYELYGSSLNIVTWAEGTDAEIVAMVNAADAGMINLADYWSVGDERQVTLSAMNATGVGESHVEQTVTFVLMHQGLYELVDGKTCNFIVGQKNGLAETGYIYPSTNYEGSWDECARRTWCNNVYYNAIPGTLRGIFKQFKTVTIERYDGNTNKISEDWFALPAVKEVFGGTATSSGSDTKFSNLTEFNALTQFDYYKTSANRIKKNGDSGSAADWWERSPRYNVNSYFLNVDSGGSESFTKFVSANLLLAPFGCI